MLRQSRTARKRHREDIRFPVAQPFQKVGLQAVDPVIADPRTYRKVLQHALEAIPERDWEKIAAHQEAGENNVAFYRFFGLFARRVFGIEA